MSQDSSLIRISSPFGRSFETTQTSRYQFSNDQRGEEPFVILQWTHSGEGTLHFHNKTHAVPADHAFLVLVPEASAYYYPPDAREPWSFSWINFYGEFGMQLCRQLRDIYGPVLPLHPQGTAGLMLTRLIRQADERTPGDAYTASQDCYSFLMEWSRELDQPSQRRAPIQTAIKICQTRFREPLGVKELAAEAGLTREHFTRLFLKETKCAPARFLRQLRVDAARQLIRQHTISLKEVALRCGFPSAKAMNRALAETPVKHTRHSKRPKRYRK